MHFYQRKSTRLKKTPDKTEIDLVCCSRKQKHKRLYAGEETEFRLIKERSAVKKGRANMHARQHRQLNLAVPFQATH